MSSNNITTAMKQIDINVPVQVYDLDELPSQDRQLLEQARQATYTSYSPYSKFKVGAAILLDNGETLSGSNQENAAYSAGTCAERATCFYAHARYPEAKFDKIAITARNEDGDFVTEPVSPCGVCRQALLEFETLAGHDVPVILGGRDKAYIVPSVRSLLPLAFVTYVGE